MKAKPIFVALGLALLLQCPLMVHAQSISITGQVKDISGAAIPNARVLLVNLSSLKTKVVNASEQGAFSFEGLALVDYEVIVAAPAFASESRRVALGEKVVVPKPKEPIHVSLEFRLHVGMST